MYLNIAVRLRDLDTHVKIKRETRHLCENMLSYHAKNVFNEINVRDKGN